VKKFDHEKFLLWNVTCKFCKVFQFQIGLMKNAKALNLFCIPVVFFLGKFDEFIKMIFSQTLLRKVDVEFCSNLAFLTELVAEIQKFLFCQEQEDASSRRAK
jgi:hypothetical protein